MHCLRAPGCCCLLLRTATAWGEQQHRQQQHQQRQVRARTTCRAARSPPADMCLAVLRCTARREGPMTRWCPTTAASRCRPSPRAREGHGRVSVVHGAAARASARPGSRPGSHSSVHSACWGRTEAAQRTCATPRAPPPHAPLLHTWPRARAAAAGSLEGVSQEWGEGASPARRARKAGLTAHMEESMRSAVAASLEVDAREKEMVGLDG